MVDQDADYIATFELKIRAYASALDPLVVLDVYENVVTRRVVAEQQIKLKDVTAGVQSFDLNFSARQGHRIELRAYWHEQCELTFCWASVSKLNSSA